LVAAAVNAYAGRLNFLHISTDISLCCHPSHCKTGRIIIRLLASHPFEYNAQGYLDRVYLAGLFR
jgi:hypothetical protein